MRYEKSQLTYLKITCTAIWSTISALVHFIIRFTFF
jgi:hypothetical protein